MIIGVAMLGTLASSPVKANDLVTKLENSQELTCGYVNRESGRLEFKESFVNVNPELGKGTRASTPYSKPTTDIYIPTQNDSFKDDVVRFGLQGYEAIADKGLFLTSWSYKNEKMSPEMYSTHVLLNLCDRALAEEKIGEWAIANANEIQKKMGMERLFSTHSGHNGGIVTDNETRMTEATRFYVGKEVLKSVLYIRNGPEIGGLAFIPASGIRVASTGPIEIALSASGMVNSGVEVGDSLANDISVAAKGATTGPTTAVSVSVGSFRGAGASSGGKSEGGDGGSGSGGGSGGGSSGGSSGGAGSSGSSGF